MHPVAASPGGKRRPARPRPGPDAIWLDEPIGLRPDVELLRGADGQPMLFVPGPDRYVHLTPGAVRLLDLLDGSSTGNQLADRVSRPAAAAGADVRRSVVAVFEELRRAGALTATRPADPTGAILARAYRRIPLTRSLDRAVRGPAALLRRVPARVIAAVMVATAAFAAVLTTAALVGSPAPTGGWTTLALVFAVVAGQLVVHEGAHAVACAATGVPVREAGVVLWGLVLPVAYVDCTDAYRVPSRWRRAGIALAGPFVDVVAVGTSAGVALLVDPLTRATMCGLVLAQLLVLAITLNPLLPGDGSHVAAVLGGEPNLRGRALASLAHLVTRRPLPPGVATASGGRRAAYLAYGILAIAAFLATIAFAGYTAAALT